MEELEREEERAGHFGLRPVLPTRTSSLYLKPRHLYLNFRQSRSSLGPPVA